MTMNIILHTPNIILFTAPSPAGDNPKREEVIEV